MKQKITITSLLAIFILLGVSCSDTSWDKKNNIPEQEMAEGFALVQTYCSACHTALSNSTIRVAPAFQAVKRQYITSNTTQEEFIQALIDFYKDPSLESSKMPRAVKRFGIMPKQEIEEAKLSKIAVFLYNADLTDSKWQKGSKLGDAISANDTNAEISLLEQGKNIAMQTKAILGKNLLGAIKTKGADGAVEFCNTRAIHLTDSMANQFHHEISRVSDQPRNPKNMAKEPFLGRIMQYKKDLASGIELKGGSLQFEENTYAYFPIVTNAMCLQCHGKKDKEIKQNTLAKIDKMYPSDKATGYSENELRGIWVIKMD
jgi:cytochrome c553